MLALVPLERFGYRPLMQRRRALNLARRAREHPPIPLVSVGNITTGGTGKTPAVQWLAGVLGAQMRIGIAARGYGGTMSQSGALVSAGGSPLLSAHEAGDEPLLHARRLPDAIVAIAQDRHHAVEICARNGARLAILDDGFQFWSLPRAFDLVLLDARAPFDNGHLLPAGRLREEPSALGRADAVLLTRSDLATSAQLARARREIADHTSAPVWEAVHAPLDLRDEKTGEILALEELRGLEVTALAALADNRAFSRQLRALGATVDTEIFRRDHFSWSGATVSPQGAIVVTTEKDAVKLDPAWFKGRLLSLRIGLTIKDEARLCTLLWRKLEEL